MRRITVLLLLAAACAGYQPPSVEPCRRALAVCDVIADSASHNNAEVTVRGNYQATPEYSVLSADECRAFVNVRLADDYKETPAIRRSFRQLLGRSPNARIQIVARGTFRAAGRQECFGGGCAPYDFAIHEFLCVSALQDSGGRTKHSSGD